MSSSLIFIILAASGLLSWASLNSIMNRIDLTALRERHEKLLAAFEGHRSINDDNRRRIKELERFKLRASGECKHEKPEQFVPPSDDWITEAVRALRPLTPLKLWRCSACHQPLKAKFNEPKDEK